MAILNMFGGGGGGARIPLEPVTNFALVAMNGEVLISWTDPVDKVASPGGELVAEWEYTIIVRKTGSAPTSLTDGVQILKETTRNQYESVTYSDTGVENDTDYYYAAYSVTSYGAVSEGVSGKVTPRVGVPVYKQTITRSSGKYSAPAGVSTGMHAVFAGSYGTSYGDGQIYAYGIDLAEIVIDNKIAAYDGIASARAGTSAIFVGGKNGSTNTASDEVYKVDSSLTLSGHDIMADIIGFTGSNPLFGCYARDMVGVSFGENALFGGGRASNISFNLGNNYDVSAVTESMTAQIIANGVLSVNLRISTGSSDTHAFFANGYAYDPDSGGEEDSIQSALVFDKSFTNTVVSTSSKALYMGSMHIGEYCVFGGGFEQVSDIVGQTGVFCYNSSLTKMDLDDLPISSMYTTGLDFNNASMLVWNSNNKADIHGARYDESLVRYDVVIPTDDLKSDKSVMNVRAASIYNDNLEYGLVPCGINTILVFETV